MSFAAPATKEKKNDTRLPCKKSREPDLKCPEKYAKMKKPDCKGNVVDDKMIIEQIMKDVPGITKAKVTDVVNRYVSYVVEQASSGQCVRVRGLGDISLRQRHYVNQTHFRLGIETSRIVKDDLNSRHRGRGQRDQRDHQDQGGQSNRRGPTCPAEVRALCGDDETPKRCFRRLSIERDGRYRHPDKGGDTARYQILTACKEKWEQERREFDAYERP